MAVKVKLRKATTTNLKMKNGSVPKATTSSGTTKTEPHSLIIHTALQRKLQGCFLCVLPFRHKKTLRHI